MAEETKEDRTRRGGSRLQGDALGRLDLREARMEPPALNIGGAATKTGRAARPRPGRVLRARVGPGDAAHGGLGRRRDALR